MNYLQHHTYRLFSFAALIVALSGASTHGQFTRSWSSASGMYDAASNCLLPVVPTAIDDVWITPNGDYIVGLQSDRAAVDVLVHNRARPTFSIAGDQSTDRAYDLSGNLTTADEAQLTNESGKDAGRFHLELFDRVTVDGLHNNADAGVLRLRDGASITSWVIVAGSAVATQRRVLITGDDTE